MDTAEVVAIGQVYARICSEEERQVDVMVTGTIATYTPELVPSEKKDSHQTAILGFCWLSEQDSPKGESSPAS